MLRSNLTWLTLIFALALARQGHAQFHAPGFAMRPWEAPCAAGPCQANTFNYGFYQTHWRRWPTSLPRVEAGAPRPRGDVEALPRFETPDPRFEGEISPPLQQRSTPAPPDRPPAAAPELPAQELPAPELPGLRAPLPRIDPLLPDPRDSTAPPQSGMGQNLAAPPRPAPIAFARGAAAGEAGPFPEPAANLGRGSIEPIPTTPPAQTPGRIGLAAHEQSAVQMKIVAPSSAAGTTAAPPPLPLASPECLIDEECVIEEIPLADAPPPVIRGAAAPPQRALPRKTQERRDPLFESLRRIVPPRRDPLFDVIGQQ